MSAERRGRGGQRDLGATSGWEKPIWRASGFTPWFKSPLQCYTWGSRHRVWNPSEVWGPVGSPRVLRERRARLFEIAPTTPLFPSDVTLVIQRKEQLERSNLSATSEGRRPAKPRYEPDRIFSLHISATRGAGVATRRERNMRICIAASVG